MRHLPNAITVLRAALIPLLAWLLVQGDYAAAVLLFVAFRTTTAFSIPKEG